MEGAEHGDDLGPPSPITRAKKTRGSEESDTDFQDESDAESVVEEGAIDESVDPGELQASTGATAKKSKLTGKTISPEISKKDAKKTTPVKPRAKPKSTPKSTSKTSKQPSTPAKKTPKKAVASSAQPLRKSALLTPPSSVGKQKGNRRIAKSHCGKKAQQKISAGAHSTPATAIDLTLDDDEDEVVPARANPPISPRLSPLKLSHLAQTAQPVKQPTPFPMPDPLLSPPRSIEHYDVEAHR